MGRHLHLTDSDFLQLTVDLYRVVDEEASVAPVLWVEGHAQESPLIPQPGSGHHLPAYVQKGLLEPAAVTQVNPHKAHLLSNEHAMCVIATVQHQHRVPEIVGHLCQAQLQTPSWVLRHLSQVAVEVRGLQNIGVAVVLIRQIDYAAERGHISLRGVPQQLVLS